MSILSDVQEFFSSIKRINNYLTDDLGRRNNILAAYYEGDQVPQLKTKNGQNDNIITNHLGVNINRSISRMFRGGVEFNLPEKNTEQQEYIDKVWDLNKKEVLLFQWGLHGGVMGTAYMKIVPDKLPDPLTGAEDTYPKLVALYPDLVRVKTDPMDKDVVTEYKIEWSDTNEGKEIAYRERTILNDGGQSWRILMEKKEGSAQWQTVSDTQWNYDFPPILHNKNLPSLNSVYGTDEESDAVNIQNKYNFVVSNTGKIIKHHAHPRTVFTGVQASAIQKVGDSPDSALALPDKEADAKNLEIQSDLISSRAFADDLQKSMASVQREIDLPSISDKLGALTNFALRVLYTDAIDKNDTKRQLYGDALLEVNRRLLVLKGWTGEDSDPGRIKWGDAIVVNLKEEIEFDEIMLEKRLVDKETVYNRYKNRYGKSWEDIKKALEDEDNERKSDPEENGTNNGGVDGNGVEQGRQPRPLRSTMQEGGEYST